MIRTVRMATRQVSARCRENRSAAVAVPSTIRHIRRSATTIESHLATQHRRTMQRSPPTEFQRYVADSTGVMLPIFGASLFEQVPATFAPVDRCLLAPDYVIAPGDEL